MERSAPPREPEGVVKYHLEFKPGSAPDLERIRELDAWRSILYALRLTGRETDRYGGLAYGNLSIRVADGRRGNPFLITGTQTAGKERLSPRDYTIVRSFDLRRHALVAEGSVAPSSEALTHAAVYLTSASVQCVIHVHSPEIWRCADQLAIPQTAPRVRYGSAELAEAVGSIVAGTSTRIIVTQGHEDGVLALGTSPEEACLEVIRYLARARALLSDPEPADRNAPVRPSSRSSGSRPLDDE